ncbi:hypothetical protein FJ250_02210 [bacterium]|nr:hypothetical protein [bacterium]
MNTRHHVTQLTPLLAALVLLTLLGGCSNDDPAAPADTSAAIDKDAAQAVAADVATDSGGVTDQLQDVALALDGLGGVKSLDPAEPDSSWVRERFRDAVYDETTGTWTITVSCRRGFPEGVPYHAMERVFTLRLLGPGGLPQQFRVVGEDTATTAEYAIVSGTGIHRLPHREHSLNALSGAFVIEGLNAEMLVINGTYLRDVSHAFETPRFARTLDGVLDVELIDVTMPRRPRARVCSAISGTITGTWVADITTTRGNDYVEEHVERDITIVLGDCEADIRCGEGRFRVPLGTGQLPR